jgi:hypothetical protein
MPRLRFLSIAGLVLALFTAGWLSAPAAALDGAAFREFQKGIAFGGYRNDAYVGSAARRSLRDLRATGATWVELVVTASTPSVQSTVIDRLGPSTPTDASVQKIIAYAHSLGLKVLLKPHVDPSRAQWRGDIGQSFSESQWSAWFTSYRACIVHYAEMAANSAVEGFSIGCELDATVRHEAEWRRVAAAVRFVYGGPLTYSDDQVLGHPDALKWWDAVDVIGEDIYPTLSDKPEPTVDDLRDGWTKYVPWLHRLAQRWHKPVLLTEIGCRSVTGGAQYPGDWRHAGVVDLDLQRRWYAAALKELGRRSWLVGTFWWGWSPDLKERGPRNTGYTPYGKPAERVLRAWYGRSL